MTAAASTRRSNLAAARRCGSNRALDRIILALKVFANLRYQLVPFNSGSTSSRFFVLAEFELGKLIVPAAT
jgi:hypothetical protein